MSPAPDLSNPKPATPDGYGTALLDAVDPGPSKQYPGYAGSAPGAHASQRSVTPSKPAASPPPNTRPTPMPKRPKGRFLVGGFLCAVITLAVYGVWNSLFRYQARGVVAGELVDVAAPWGGIVQSLHVREGDDVRQGQLLATLVNLQLQQQADEVADELRVAQARLDAARIETLSAQLMRIRERLKQGEIRAPQNGHVTRMHVFAGEYAEVADGLMEVLVDGSIEAVIYVSQRAAADFPIGQPVNVEIPPYRKPVRCIVTRVGDVLVEPPKSLERHSPKNTTLLPVHLELPRRDDGVAFRLGSEVCLPTDWLPKRGVLSQAEDAR